MPAYVHLIRIDWHPERVLEHVKPTLPALDEQMTSSDHTFHTFDARLREIAAAEPSLVADALVQDGHRAYWLFQVQGGRVEATRVEERAEDALAEPIRLPLDEVVDIAPVRDRDEIESLIAAIDEYLVGGDGELQLPLSYPDLATLQTVVDRSAAAIETGGGSFVAEVGLDRYLVELAPGRGRIRRLVAITDPAMFARLLAHDYTAVPAPPREPGGRYELGLYWPEDMLQFLQDSATRVDTSLSAMAQQAFLWSRDEIARNDRPALESALRSFGPASAATRRQTLYFPGDMLDEMELQARRLDSSVSFVAQCAIALSHRSLPGRRVIDV